MIKEVTQTSKELLYSIVDRIPYIWPRRKRRLDWAAYLPINMGTSLALDGDGKLSALGWGALLYVQDIAGAEKSPKALTNGITIDGIKYKEFMPQNIRKWYGINELQALKIQALNMNGSNDKNTKSTYDKIVKLIRAI